MSKSGLSVSQRVGPLTLNSRGRGSLRLGPGLSYRFGSRRKNDPTGALIGLAILGVVLTASVAFFVARAGIVLFVWLVRWAYFGVASIGKQSGAPQLAPTSVPTPLATPATVELPAATTGQQDAVVLHASKMIGVVGTSYRQPYLQAAAASATDWTAFKDELKGAALEDAVAGTHNRWFRAVIVREPDNPQDPNAIAVHANGKGRIGYLSRSQAAKYQAIFPEISAEGSSAGTCPAFIVGGEDGTPTLGARICLSSPQKIIQTLSAERD